MNNAESDRTCQTLLEMWKGTSARIAQRRGYEWKIAFGFWGAMLITMSVLLSKGNLDSWWFWYLYFLVGVLVTIAHNVYIFKYLAVRNRDDSRLARTYEKQILKALDQGVVDYQSIFRVLCEIENRPSRRERAPNDSWWKDPSDVANVFQGAVTAFLAFVGPLAVHFVSAAPVSNVR